MTSVLREGCSVGRAAIVEYDRCNTYGEHPRAPVILLRDSLMRIRTARAKADVVKVILTTRNNYPPCSVIVVDRITGCKEFAHQRDIRVIQYV